MTIHNNYQDQVPISVFSSFQLQHIQDQVPIYVFPSFQLQHEVNDLLPNNRNPEAKYTHSTIQNFLVLVVLLWLYKEVMDYPTCFQDRSLQINQDLAASQKNQLNIKDIQLYSLPTDRIRMIREGVAVVPPHEWRSYLGMVRLVE